MDNQSTISTRVDNRITIEKTCAPSVRAKEKENNRKGDAEVNPKYTGKSIETQGNTNTKGDSKGKFANHIYKIQLDKKFRRKNQPEHTHLGSVY